MNPDEQGNVSRRGKIRGPYKSYLYQTGVQIPRNTLKARRKEAQRIGIQNPPVPDLDGGEGVDNLTINVDPEDQALNEDFVDDCSDVGSHSDSSKGSGGLSQETASDSEGNDTDSEQDSDAAGDERSFLNVSQDFEDAGPGPHHDSNDDSQNGSSDEDTDRGSDDDGETVSKEEEDTGHGRKNVNYAEKYQLNDLLHPDFPHTKLEVLIMILHLAIRHCNTQSFIENQIKLINTLFGRNVLDVSFHMFKNVFPSSSNIQFHYFCDLCDMYIGCKNDFPEEVKLTTCPKCQKNINLHSVDSKNYFITLSIKEQIETLLKRSDVKLLSRDQLANDNISDIFDGELYKRYFQQGSPLSNKDALTCIINTDGVRVFENSDQGSLYPVFLHLNELAPEVRFKVDNLILAGLWFGKGSPNMALFLKPILKQILDLSQSGVSVPQPDGTFKNRPLFAIGLSVDSVTKPKILCQHQFNGSFSCLYCLHPNDAVSDEGSVNHKHFDTSVTYPERTDSGVIRDMMEADSLQRRGQLKKSNVRGFFGLSILLMLSDLIDSVGHNPFHFVWSVMIDYMHALLEGVCSDLLTLYIGILSTDQIEIVNRRLAQITLPHGMSRKPRPVGGKVKYKAKEYRSLFLYFALPCFEDLLPYRNYYNLKYFVSSLHILLGDNISVEDLTRVRRYLHDFVTGFQSLYGLQKVTYNLHLCTHLVDQVLQAGPLWCYSNFIFESGNGHLVKLIRGTRSVISEISRKYTQLQRASLCIDKNPVSNVTLEFCSSILGLKYSRGQKIDGVTVTGSHSYVNVNNDEKILIGQHNVPLQNDKVRVLNRVIKNGTLYVSQSYSKTKTTNDSCAQLKDGSYVILDKIVLASDNTIKCLVKPIRIAEGYQLLNPVKKCPYYVFGAPSVINLNEISRKCVFINFDMKAFVCSIPNNNERD